MVPPEAQLLLQQPDVLLNLFIATGLTGAITKTPSHSAAPQLPRGFVCIITKDNASQYFMFNFKTHIGMTGSLNPQRMCTCTSKLQGSCRLFSRKQIYLIKLNVGSFQQCGWAQWYFHVCLQQSPLVFARRDHKGRCHLGKWMCMFASWPGPRLVYGKGLYFRGLREGGTPPLVTFGDI